MIPFIGVRISCDIFAKNADFIFAVSNASSRVLANSISKQLVELMDGEIGLDSTLGKGSCFWFTAEFEAQEDSHHQEGLEILERSRILIVDDNDAARNILLHQAKSIGMLVEEAKSGKQALKLLKAAAKNHEPFEIVVIDLDMPRMDGVELSQKIRQDMSLRTTRILLMPSVNNHKIAKNIKSLGIDSYIYKPIRQTQFYKVLSNVLTGQDEEIQNTSLVEEKQNPKEESTKPEDSSVRQIDPQVEILIAEDNRVNQMVIVNQLKSLGYKTDLKTNGQEVLEAIQDKEYSLILMDCQMPVMDGIETATKIREIEHNSDSHIPIIAVSAGTIDGDREKCLLAGMDDHLPKPMKKEELAQMIEKWLDRNDLVSSNKAKQGEILEESQHVDNRLRELADACGIDINLECIEVFMEDFDESIKKLKDALEKGDGEAIDQEAHKLKGSSANMGAVRLPEICQNLMQMVRDDQVAETRNYIKDISSEHETLKPIYQQQKQYYRELVNNLQPVN